MSGVTAFLCTLIIAATLAGRHDDASFIFLLTLAAVSAITDPRPGKAKP